MPHSICSSVLLKTSYLTNGHSVGLCTFQEAHTVSDKQIKTSFISLHGNNKKNLFGLDDKQLANKLDLHISNIYIIKPG